MNFGDRIKKLRHEKGLSQEQLAEICGSSVIFIRHIEKSRRTPNLDLLVCLCNNLGTSPDYLLQDSLTHNPSDNDKQKIISFINKLTPEQLKFCRDWFKVVEKYIINGKGL